MTFLRLLRVFFRIGIQTETAYRANFWFQALESTIGLGTALGAVLVVFSQTETLAGWHQPELLAVLGVYFLVIGAIVLVIAPSLQKFMEDVQQGTFDYTLTKPADAQLLVSISEIRIFKALDILLGSAVLGVALSQMTSRVGLAEAASFGISLLAGGRDRLQLLALPRDALVLVHPRREHRDGVLEHVLGGSLARRDLPELAADHPHGRGSRRLCGHGSGGVARGACHTGHASARHRAGPRLPRALALVLAPRAQGLLGRLGLGGPPQRPRYATRAMNDVAKLDIIFSGGTLDRADVKRRDAAWIQQRLADERTRILPVWRLLPLVREGETKLAWATADLLDSRSEGTEPILLGLDEDDVAHFAIDISSTAEPLDEMGWKDVAHFPDLRAIAGTLPAGEAAIAAQARQLVDWHARHRFCAVCGEETRAHDAGYVRRCADCSAEHFPRTDPVVIMLATRGDRCLLGRQPSWPSPFFSALAGFVEPGENIEEAVRRRGQGRSGHRRGAGPLPRVPALAVPFEPHDRLPR